MLQVQDEKLIRTTREKDMILEKFRNRGMRITKQRRLILDIVFEQDCTAAKKSIIRLLNVIRILELQRYTGW